MSTIDDAAQVAVVGSPSSNSEITLDLLSTAAAESLVGSMLFLANPVGDGTELALGTVTEIVTRNQWHENTALRGVIAQRGSVPNLSGASGDVRGASIRIQAAYKQDGPGQPWRQSGPNLRMSPGTGCPIRRVTDALLTDLTVSEPDLHFLGPMQGSDIRFPLNMPDFAGPAGSAHSGIFGVSGAGKSVFTSYYLAGQMRHLDLGMIIVDPQGQFSNENGLTFSLQGFAAELGREVVVRRISTDLRLQKDAPLLGELLGKTKFCREIIKMSSETQEILMEELVKVLRKRTAWEEEDSSTLLRELLAEISRDNGSGSYPILGRVYADQAKQTRLADAMTEILAEPDRFADVLRQFAPLHNLFCATNPDGGTRHSMWGTVAHVFDKDSRGGRPAPLLVLDMSVGEIPWSDAISDDDAREAAQALAVLDQDPIKASILVQTFRSLRQAAETKFRNGQTLNTLVVLDEASRFAPPPRGTDVEEIAELSADLADGARTLRKFGIGLCFITQTVRSLNPAIWEQLTIRMVGFGLGGADLDKVAEHLDSKDSLALYRAAAPPRATGVYPWMLAGPVSPMSFTRAPVFVSAYTDFDDFRADNDAWIRASRLAQGKAVLTGPPAGKARPAAGPRRVVVDGAAVPTAPASLRQAVTAAAARTKGLQAEAEIAGASSLRPDGTGWGTAAVDVGDDDDGFAIGSGEPPF